MNRSCGKGLSMNRETSRGYDGPARFLARWPSGVLLLALALLAGRLSGAPGEAQAQTENKRPSGVAGKAQEGKAEMKAKVQVSVGVREGDIRGADNRALQAAVDYVANLGGGVVE